MSSLESTEDLVFLPLGGIGEIGMNLSLYGLGTEEDREWVIVDLGITFPDEHYPGIDRIMADISFLEERADSIAAIILTHAHEDHYGAVLDLWPRLQVPVYGTAFAIDLLRAKIAAEKKEIPIPFHVISTHERFKVGRFDIECVAVPHSIPESVGLVIRTPLGMVYHSGDWRIDDHPQVGGVIDIAKFQSLGKEGCDVLMCDSTNAVSVGKGASESDVLETLRRIVPEVRGLISVTAFASNLARIRSVALVAKENGRQVIVVGRAMRRVITVASELGYIDDLPAFLDEGAFADWPRDKLVALMTGSQGESRAALTRAALDDHPHVTFASGDTVIFSARAIPGNEKAIYSVQNLLIDKKIRVITPDDALVHVSGHPCTEELLQMYGWLQPRYIVPIHGEAQHLEAQANLVENAGFRPIRVRNGGVLRLLPGDVEQIDELSCGRLCRDGNVLISDLDKGLKERKALAYSGCIVISLVMEERHGRLIDFDFAVFGIPEVLCGETDNSVYRIVETCVEEAFSSTSKSRRIQSDTVVRSIKRAVSSQVSRVWGKRPKCRVMAILC